MKVEAREELEASLVLRTETENVFPTLKSSRKVSRSK